MSKNPAVIFADNFEEGDLGARWDEKGRTKGKALSLAPTSNPSGGKQCLRVEARLGENTGDGLTKWFEPAPQVLENVRYEKGARDPLSAPSVKEAIKAAEDRLNRRGRLLVRKSGTEPLVRIMAEGADETLVRKAVAGVKNAVVAAANAA